MPLPTVSVKGTSYPAFNVPSNGVIADGIYYSTPSLGIGSGPRFGEPQFEEVEHFFPDVQGIGITRLSSFGPCMIQIDLAIAAATIAACETVYNSLVQALAQLARYTVIARSTQFDGCRLKGANYLGQTSMGTKSILVYGFTFKQMSPGNT